MPIGSTLDVVIQEDDLVVLGPPSSIDVAVDIGPRGAAGTQLYTGAFNPNDLTFQQFQDIYGDIPRLKDLFLRTDEGPEYGSFYQYTNIPGGDQWEIVVDLIDAIELFFDLNTDFVLKPKSGGTGINNGTSTITIGGNFRTLGSFPLDFGLSGSTVLALPTSGSVAVWQDKLSRFAPTTSAEFASVITDETGTGQVVFNTSPNISTSVTTNSSSFNLVNSNATTVNFAGAGNNITVGANGSGTLNLRNATVDMTGDLIVRGSDIIAAEPVFNLVDTVATTVNFARAATTVNIGNASGNTNVNNNLAVTGDASVAGGDITTTATTFNLINTNATTLNVGGAATAVTIGANSGLTTVRNDLTVSGNAIISGNLLVSGSATIIDTERIVSEDPVITLGGDTPPTAPDGKDRGLEFRWHDGVDPKVGFFGFDNITQRFKFIPDGTNNLEVFSGTFGDFDINDIYAAGIISASGGIIGELTGNAATASKLFSAVDIALGGDLSGSASFDGSGSIVINATIEPDSVALGTDTTGNYVEDATAGDGINISGSGEGANLIITNTGVLSLAGTAGETTVSASAGNITLGLDSDVNITNDLTAGGNLTVNGASAYLNVDELLIEDHLITLGFGTTGSPSETGGIEIARGDEPTVSIIWNETVDQWEFTNDGTNYLALGSGTGDGGFVTNFLTMGA